MKLRVYNSEFNGMKLPYISLREVGEDVEVIVVDEDGNSVGIIATITEDGLRREPLLEGLDADSDWKFTWNFDGVDGRIEDLT